MLGNLKYRYSIYLLVIFFGCKKFVQVPYPPTERPADEIFSNDIGATSTILGIYGNMIGQYGYASGNCNSITTLAGLSADELKTRTANMEYKQFEENQLLSNNEVVTNFLYGPPYNHIYAANAILEDLEKPNGVSLPVKIILQGEARFVRAFAHFYLFNMFGPIPYIDTTSYDLNRLRARTPRDSIYMRVVQDLTEAYNKLSYGTKRIRANRGAAAAMLARVHLYFGNWLKADTFATELINNSMYKLVPLNDVFLSNSLEAIWQLKPSYTDRNTWEAWNFILKNAPSVAEENSFSLTGQVLKSFESADNRRKVWIDSLKTNDAVYYYPNKYKVKWGSDLVEYSIVLRLAEQYLIRAEARAHLGNFLGALADLNTIRNRAGLPNVMYNTKNDLLKAIFHERQVELFTEWGHRWFDLKRSKQVDIILKNIKPGWQGYDTLYPIPYLEVRMNRNFTQNPGYGS